ncbi:hypothetical protein QF047_003993 [Arthrobacter sp. W4I7]|nr:hypothetical protein [Arthrobacter sp. W4I7]MDQ0693033.1 hypothetical protein [Arthrobacter sp. W4I7]
MMSSHSSGRDQPVHVERQPGERTQPGGIEVVFAEVVLELLVPLLHGQGLAPDVLHDSEVLLGQAHLPERAEQRRGQAVHGGAEVRSEAQPVAAELLVHLADLQDLGIVRALGRVDLVAELLVVLLGQRKQPAEQFLACGSDDDLVEAKRVGGLELPGEEVELLVGRHVPVFTAAHVQVRANGTRGQAVAVHAVAPKFDEVVVHVGVGAQHLGDVELDARTEAFIGDGFDQCLRGVEPGGEFGGQ